MSNEEVAKAQKLQRGAWTRVQQIGRQYARMKAFGNHLNERGVVMHIRPTEVPEYLSMLQAQLLEAVVEAYAEDAQMGAVVADNL